MNPERQFEPVKQELDAAQEISLMYVAFGSASCPYSTFATQIVQAQVLD